MADVPDLDKTGFIFVGQVTTVDPPRSTHGRSLQDITYTKIDLKMGPKSSFREPKGLFHDVTTAPLPNLVKVGNTLIVGGLLDGEETYVHKADQGSLQAIRQALDAFVERLTTAYLKDGNFDVKLSGESDAFFYGESKSLAAIAEFVWKQVRIKVGDADEGSIENVRKYVDQYYQRCRDEAQQDRPWQIIVQVGQNPAIPFWASRAQPPGVLGSWQQGQQFAAGWQSRQLGWIHTGQLTLNLFDNADGKAVFSNALASYQFSYAKMLLNPIYSTGPSDNWAYLVGTVFAQVGLGIGNNNSDPHSGWNQIHVGIMHQEQAGLQLGLNIWKITIIAQGAVVYSGSSLFGLPFSSGPFANQGSTLGAAAFGGIQGSF